jgi:DhnA family fructose-bisphosphate aldolase class Ia
MMREQNLTLQRFFSTGPAIVVAMDHGMFDGPIPGVNNVGALPGVIWPDIDAVLMSPGMLQDIGKGLFNHWRSPLAMTRINWSTIYCFAWNYHSGDTVEACRPVEALRKGAQMVLISLSLKTGSQERDARNIELFCRLSQEAHDLGLPVVGEYFPVDDERLSEDEMYEEVKIGCRVLYELGADVIKTFYTKKFDTIVAGCPTPILSLGGKRLPSDLAALEYAQQQIRTGAAGIVFGRNVIQTAKPLEMQKALIEVVKHGVAAREAAPKHGLT